MIFKEHKTYDTLRLIGQIFIPVSVFICSIISVLDIPHADVVTAILGALDTLIGSLITISKQQYDKQKDNEDGLDNLN